MPFVRRRRSQRFFRCISVLFVGLVLGLSTTPGSAEMRAELYTMGPGDFLFTKFGHAAICLVNDEASSAEGVCYNYGTTDFSRPIGLSWDVIRGRALFWVSVGSLSEMLGSFEWSDRTIYVQPLPLSPDRVLDLSHALAFDASSENREYVYNHFLENCSTRPRDLIDGATGGRLSRARIGEFSSYREYALRGLGHERALLLVSDLILGRWVDRPVSAFEAMFLPDVLRAAVTAELGVEPRVVYERRAPLPPVRISSTRREGFIGALAVTLLAFLVALRGSSGAQKFVHRAAGLVMGGLGLLLVGLALASVLPELRVNELSVVFLPFDLLLARRNAFSFRYALFRLAMLVVVAVLVSVGVFLQPVGPYWTLGFGLLAASAVALSPMRHVSQASR
jgi:hypothetical protein